MLEVDQVRDCKRLHGMGMSIREISRQLGVSRNTVRVYVRGERTPGVYDAKERRAQPVRDALRPRVHQMLRAEIEAAEPVPKKQRLTAARIHRIINTGDVDVSASVVRRLVSEIRLDLRDPLKHGYLPLEYEPGRDAQVDFFEAAFEHPEDGLQKVHVLLVRACYSARTFVYVAPNQTREALLEGLIRAFEFFGGVFHTIWFDNLTPAVKKVLSGRSRELQKAFARFEAYYGFKAEFCSPGKGNEKGGVEGKVKYARHEIFSPVPKASERRELQAHCDAFMEREVDRRVRSRELTIGEAFAHEVGELLPLPDGRFEVGEIRIKKVSPRSWISIATNHYSTPVEWIGHEVTVRVDAEVVVIRRGLDEVVRHPRSYGKCHAVLELDHYLPLLRRKCRGLDRSMPFRRWIATVGPCWRAYLRELRRNCGEVKGTRDFVDTLFLMRSRREREVTAAVEKALETEAVSLAVVRFHLSASVEQNAPDAVDQIDYRGPVVATHSTADYMALCRPSREGEVSHA